MVPLPCRDRPYRDAALGGAVQNAVEIPDPEIEALQAALETRTRNASSASARSSPGTFGTLFNTQVFVGPDGSFLGKHQKLMPTVGERLVHMGGYGDTFGAIQTDFGPMSGLICGENSNPLAVFALTAEATRVHVMSWPNHLPTNSDRLRERVKIDSQAFAQMSKAYVISACGTFDEPMIELLELSPGRRGAAPQPGLHRRLHDRRPRQPRARRSRWARRRGSSARTSTSRSGSG